MSNPRPKRSDSFGIRFEPVLRAALEAAATDSGMNVPEALRLAAEAMVVARHKYGRIPRDMEIRQASLVTKEEAAQLDAAMVLLRRAVEIDRAYTERLPDNDLKAAEAASDEIAATKPAPRRRSQEKQGRA